MTRVLVVLLTAGLLLASSAQAKGPHAILTPGDDPAEAGRPWRATLEVVEFRGLSRVELLARQGTREVTAALRRVWADPQGAARYEARLTLPSEGHWELFALSGKRRFNFQAVAVGSGRVPPDYVAFAVGSRAEREGAGGVYFRSGDAAPSSGGKPLPPEEFTVAAEDDGGGGPPFWVFPLAGVVLAGAGVLRLRSR
jgi:hypothetical protein